MTRESTTVVNQLKSSYRYMLGASSLVLGVQSYSDSSKKSSNLEVISPVTRPRALVSVLEKEAVAFSSRIEPPLPVDLGNYDEKRSYSRFK